MNSIVEILLTGLIDPLIWIKSMSSLGLKRSRIQYMIAFITCYILVIGRAFIAEFTNMGMISVLLTILLAVYLFTATIFLFEGKVKEKILYVCMLCCVAFSAELIVIESCLFIKPDALEVIMQDGWINLLCTIVSKILQILCCYWLFGQKKLELFYQNEEEFSLRLISFFLLADILLKFKYNEEITNAVLLFSIIEVLFLWYIFSTLLALKTKEKKLYKLNQEVDSKWGEKSISNNIDHFKHEFSTYAFIMKNLWYCKEYDKLAEYMDRVFKDVPEVELLYEHSNFPVRITVSTLMQLAEKAGIANGG